jgi:hypothetical protein
MIDPGRMPLGKESDKTAEILVSDVVGFGGGSAGDAGTGIGF